MNHDRCFILIILWTALVLAVGLSAGKRQCEVPRDSMAIGEEWVE